MSKESHSMTHIIGVFVLIAAILVHIFASLSTVKTTNTGIANMVFKNASASIAHQNVTLIRFGTWKSCYFYNNATLGSAETVCQLAEKNFTLSLTDSSNGNKTTATISLGKLSYLPTLEGGLNAGGTIVSLIFFVCAIQHYSWRASRILFGLLATGLAIGVVVVNFFVLQNLKKSAQPFVGIQTNTVLATWIISGGNVLLLFISAIMIDIGQQKNAERNVPQSVMMNMTMAIQLPGKKQGGKGMQGATIQTAFQTA